MGRGIAGGTASRLPLVAGAALLGGASGEADELELAEVELAALEMAALGERLRADRIRTPETVRRRRLEGASKRLAKEALFIAALVALGRTQPSSLGPLIVARESFNCIAKDLSKVGLLAARREVEAIAAVRLAPIPVGTRVRSGDQVGRVTGRFRSHNCGGGCYRVEVTWQDGTRGWPPTETLS